jgi:serine phosphatase RsbU (regulator of sigma subunit)
MWREDSNETIRVSRTIVNKVMETQEGILSADVMMDEEFNKAQSIADFRIRSMMCAPLIDSDGKSMGVMQIDTVKQSKRFTQEDLEVLLAVASQAGIAIDNAEMHERAMRQQIVDRDLELAREVQMGFLPKTPPELSGYEFFHFYRPANQVGGDYYDYLSAPDGRIAVIVADVVGKGVAAALLMAKLSAEARYCVASGEDAGGAMSMLNERLCRLKLDRFVTAALLMLDSERHEVAIANAGHMPPVHRNRKGEALEPGDEIVGLPLGIAPDMSYRHKTISLQPGESLTTYTDGLNEAANEDGVLYGMEQIRRQVRQVGGLPSDIGKALIEHVEKFVGQAEQSDDMCMVSFGRLPR